MGFAASQHKPLYNIELVKAYGTAGEPLYAYLLLPQKHVEPFREKLKTDDTLELERYGIVLAQGNGHIPAQEHATYIHQRFGAQ